MTAQRNDDPPAGGFNDSLLQQANDRRESKENDVREAGKMTAKRNDGAAK
jgi:hypothetical protein